MTSMFFIRAVLFVPRNETATLPAYRRTKLMTEFFSYPNSYTERDDQNRFCIPYFTNSKGIYGYGVLGTPGMFSMDTCTMLAIVRVHVASKFLDSIQEQ